MLLRRVIEHVKAQNWTAVALDFFIVVVGVFIGIQVANWNNRVVDKRKADERLTTILIDIEQERAILKATREYWATTKAYAEMAVAGFNNDQSVDDEQFVISAYQASQAIFPKSYRATYEQIVSSGSINIAGNTELISAIMNYYIFNWTTAERYTSLTPYRANIRRAIPHVIQLEIRENCGDQIVTAGAASTLYLPKTCDLDLPDTLFAEAAEILRQQPELLMDLRYQLSDLDTKLQNLSQLDLQIDDLFAAAAPQDGN